MKEALEHPIPSDLFSLYEASIERITLSSRDSKEIRLSVLSWILHAKRPLRISELRSAIAVQEGDTDLADLYPEKFLIEVCESMVSYDQASGIVTAAHETIREFLTERYSEQLLSEKTIATTCLTYLSFPAIQLRDGEDKEYFQQIMERYPFAEYAASYWGEHIEGDTEEDPEIFKLLSSIAQSPATIDAIAHLATSEPEGWEAGFEVQRMKTYKLIHFIAQYDLTKLAKNLLTLKRLNVNSFYRPMTN